jgi:competence protein ComEA
MKLTKDESRALAFVAFLLILSAIARYATTPAPIHADGPELDLKALEQASQAKLDAKGGSNANALIRAGKAARASVPDTALDPNTATVEELAALPRISLAVAQRIVAARDTGARFEMAEDLQRVPGITRRTLEAIAGHLTVPRAESTSRGEPGIAHSPTRPLAASGQAGSESGEGSQGSGQGAQPPGQTIDVNRATVQDLESVPGIGPFLAKKILNYRTENGPFRSIDDLLAVRGIGPATLGRLRPYLRLAP